MAYLLDTNAVIALLNDTTSKTALRARRESPGDVPISVTACTSYITARSEAAGPPENAALIGRVPGLRLEDWQA